jgi:Lon protease-like protein
MSSDKKIELETESEAETQSDAEDGERTFREALRRLPMFPLPNVVLFPHALLPLHIFEERYRALARDVLTGRRFLAISLIAPGEDAEKNEKPAVQKIAGVGEVVMAHELADGRFNLVVRGRARIHIDEELISDQPYRLIAASVLPDLAPAERGELLDADQSLRALVGHLADAIPDGGELLRQVVAAQETPSELVDVLAAALVVDPGQRQALLETRDVMKRIERVSAEVVAMTSRISTSSTVN